MTQHDKNKKPATHVPASQDAQASQLSYRRNQAEGQFAPSPHSLANISIGSGTSLNSLPNINMGSSSPLTMGDEASAPHEAWHVAQQG